MSASPPRTPPKRPRPYPAPLVPSPVIEDLTRRLAQVVPEKAGVVVAEFWRTQSARPVLSPTDGPQQIVTFLWRDAIAAEVLLFVNRLSDERALADSLMRHVPGTDVWWLAYRMDPDWRASYAFLPRRPDEDAPWWSGDQVQIRQVLDRGRPDPANPVSCRNRAGVVSSVVELPAAPAQPFSVARDDHPADRVQRLVGPQGRRLWVHRPVGLGAGSPVILVLDGDVERSAGAEHPGSSHRAGEPGRRRTSSTGAGDHDRLGWS